MIFGHFGELSRSNVSLQELFSDTGASSIALRTTTSQINLTLSDRTVTIGRNLSIPSQDLVILGDSGDSSLFPIDQYGFSFEIAGTVLDPTVANASNASIVQSPSGLPLKVSCHS